MFAVLAARRIILISPLGRDRKGEEDLQERPTTLAAFYLRRDLPCVLLPPVVRLPKRHIIGPIRIPS